MKALAALLSIGALLATAAPSALAETGSACNPAGTTQVFAPWGDLASYSPFKGSTFESGASGWSWGNKANIVAGDDAHMLSAAGSHAVNLPSGGTARSPWMCVDSTMPSMRFFLRRVAGSGNLTVRGLLNTSSGKQLSVVAVVGAGSAWQASPVIEFPASITAATAFEALDAQFQFTAEPGSSFRIDDPHLDPYHRG